MEGTYIFSQKSRHNDLTSMITFFCPRKFWIYNVYKSLYSQSYGSHEQMWELDHKEVWALKNWCFWTVVLEKTLDKSSLDCKEIKPVHPKVHPKISPEYSLEGLMLKLQSFGHLMQRANSLEKTLLLGKNEGRRRRGQQRLRRLDGIADSTEWVWASSRRWWRTGKPGMLQSMGSQRVGKDWATEQQQEDTKFVAICYWSSRKLIHSLKFYSVYPYTSYTCLAKCILRYFDDICGSWIGSFLLSVFVLCVWKVHNI